MAKVIFDLDGVLIRSRKNDGTFLWSEQIERDLDIPASVLRQAFHPVFWHEALIGKQEFEEKLASVFALHAGATSPRQLIDYWLRSDLNWRPEVLALAAELKQDGHSLYLATNQDRIRGNFIREQEPIRRLFSYVLTSADLGFAKPDSRFFQEASRVFAQCEDTGGGQSSKVSRARPLIYIDDDIRNIASASIVGWIGLHFDPDRDETAKVESLRQDVRQLLQQ